MDKQNRMSERAFGYLCPACHRPVLQTRSRFALEASGATFACVCGKSSLRVAAEGERFRLAVPCGICGGEHDAICTMRRLVDGQSIGLSCPQTRQLCCFIGTEYEVERELEHLSDVVRRETDSDGSQAFTNDVIMYEVLSELREIASRPHGVSCGCGSERYRMELNPNYVDLICAECGARLRIPAVTDEDLDRLCCNWTLRIGGGRKN